MSKQLKNASKAKKKKVFSLKISPFCCWACLFY